MSGRKRRDRPLTMDELLHRARASTSSGDTISTPTAAQPSSIAPPSGPSTSHQSPLTPPPAPAQPAAADAQRGISLFS